MKLTKYLAMAAVALMSVTFSACESDDPDPSITVIPDEIKKVEIGFRFLPCPGKVR